MSSSSSSVGGGGGGGGRGSDAAYAEAMHAILNSEPCRGLVTEATRLLPHVYIGSQSNAEDLSTMRRIGITHVLNCAGYKGPRPSPNASPYDGLGIAYYEFKAEDSDRYDITRHFNDAFRYLDSAKREGGTVLVHCALGINRSAAVCVAYMMVERRLPLLSVTRIIKERRRIVLANKAFQRQLVGFARGRGLLGELPTASEEDGEVDGDGQLSGTGRRLTLNDRSSNGLLPVDWRLNGLRADLPSASRRLDTSGSYRSRTSDDWRRLLSRPSDRGTATTSYGRYDHLSAGDYSPRRDWLSSRGGTTRSRESDDVVTSRSADVGARQYRASKSATSLLPVSSSSRTSRPPTSVHGRSSSTSRFSLGFL